MSLKTIEIAGIVLVTIELVLLFRLFRKKGGVESQTKWLAFFGIVTVPVILMLTANYHVFETSKKVEACMGCHVMKPMGTDMLDPKSQTLAARHVTNNWIKKDECYACHKDYGLNGTLKAKMDGYRHLMRYITDTYSEPIVYRGEFNSMNCMSCHEGTPAFSQHKAHVPVIANLKGDNPTISCTNCHGKAHPSRLERTPGSPEYDRLIGMEVSQHTLSEDEIAKLKAWLQKID